ncbi:MULTISPECIES: flagellar hook-basal body complex protein FliE [Clostridium]|uniref:flagellar hook-basal body complex protein FliE n=1 Tax=Clostridium TaxID=1485 RepID=UPI00082590CC|nr:MULTISPECIES: flagellar hook-basal body complex protein FliE [Clostridium]PJI09864.1 flagellar hook-basal body complex protein FliE [Clostridium sp. CT7]
MRVDEFIPDSVKNALNSTGVVNKNAVSSNNNVIDDENSGKDTNNVNFGNILEQKLQDVNNKQIDADNTTNQFVEGDNVDVHKVMLSTEEAKLSLELAIQVRNKLVDAYQELNRMQL